MTKNLIQSILQIMAVATMLIGLILVTQVWYTTLEMKKLMPGNEEYMSMTLKAAGNMGVMSALIPLIWGAVLYFVAPIIARHINSRQDVV